MLTVKQAAQRAGVSVALVYQWIESRNVAHYRLGGKGKRGKIAIAEEDLDTYLRSCRVDSVDSKPAPASKPKVPVKLRHLTLRPS